MKEILDELEGDYMDKPSLIPVFRKGRKVTTVSFEHNLNMVGEPSYVNEGGNLGLKRIERGKFSGRLVLMYEDEFYPTQNRGKFISENEAYDLCHGRGKNALIKKLDIHPDYEVDDDDGFDW